jgi:hypothetical protein
MNLATAEAFVLLYLGQGELTITGDMEELQNALFLDQVPRIWTQRAYPSLQGLTAWFADLLLRLRELETWSTDFVVSCCSAVCYFLVVTL